VYGQRDLETPLFRPLSLTVPAKGVPSPKGRVMVQPAYVQIAPPINLVDGRPRWRSRAGVTWQSRAGVTMKRHARRRDCLAQRAVAPASYLRHLSHLCHLRFWMVRLREVGREVEGNEDFFWIRFAGRVQ
jgi:hypothetical protein